MTPPQKSDIDVWLCAHPLSAWFSSRTAIGATYSTCVREANNVCTLKYMDKSREIPHRHEMSLMLMIGLPCGARMNVSADTPCSTLCQSVVPPCVEKSL